MSAEMAAASQGTSQFTASECCRYTTLMDVNKKMGGEKKKVYWVRLKAAVTHL